MCEGERPSSRASALTPFLLFFAFKVNLLHFWYNTHCLVAATVGIVANVLPCVNRVKYICNKKVMSIFATRLKELRGTESQAAFSAAIGVNRVQYAKYESGQNSPSVDLLERICRVHSCSADWLLGLRGTAPQSSTPPLPHSSTPNSQLSPGSLPQCAKCPHRKLADKMRKMLGGGK